MNIQEVPQDKKNFNQREVDVQKVLYVTDQEGNYTQTKSYGWESENLALEQAWEEIEIQLSAVQEEIKNSISSPIKFYMIKNRMDISILASYVGKWKWQVKRHCKASVFQKLSDGILLKYAKVFNITTEELKNLKGFH
jgi:hypothetical protein